MLTQQTPVKSDKAMHMTKYFKIDTFTSSRSTMVRTLRGSCRARRFRWFFGDLRDFDAVNAAEGDRWCALSVPPTPTPTPPPGEEEDAGGADEMTLSSKSTTTAVRSEREEFGELSAEAASARAVCRRRRDSGLILSDLRGLLDGLRPLAPRMLPTDSERERKCLCHKRKEVH